MNTGARNILAAALCAVAASAFAAGGSLTLDFNDLKSQSDAQDEKIERARTVLHDVFSGYCVEKLVSASVNVRDDGSPDIEIDSDTKNLKINFRIALDEVAYSNWVASTKIRLAEIADRIEESSGDNDARMPDFDYRSDRDEDGWIRLDGLKYTFDKRVNLGLCSKMFLPSRSNMFKFQILGKEGECLYDSCPFYEWHYTGSDAKPMPEIFSPKMTEKRTPLIFHEEIYEPDFLQNIKEIRCNYGRSNHSWYPEMEKKHPVVSVPLKYGVNLDMVYVAAKDGQSLYCAMLPFTWEQAFACGFVERNCTGSGFMGATHHKDGNDNRCGFDCLPPTDAVVRYLNALPAVRELGLEFMVPNETLWLFAALGGGREKAAFGRLPNGREGYYYEPGYLEGGNSGKWRYSFQPQAVLAQKTPNAYGIHDMIGNHHELCIPEAAYGPIEEGKLLGRTGIIDVGEGSVPKAREFFYKGNIHALHVRLFAKRKNGGEALQSEAHASDRTKLEQRAEAGDAGALCELGNRHFFGDGDVLDYDKAFTFFSKAAELGSAEGCRRLAQCHEYGLGAPKDMLQALKLYEKADSLGDGLAGDWLSRNSAFRKSAKAANAQFEELLDKAKRNSGEAFTAKGFYIGMPVEDAKFLLRQYMPDVDIREGLSIHDISNDFNQNKVYFDMPLSMWLLGMAQEIKGLKEQYALTNGLWLAHEHQAFCRTDETGNVVQFNFIGETLESILGLKDEDEAKMAQSFAEKFGGSVEVGSMEESIYNFGKGDAPTIPVKQSIWRVLRKDGESITVFGGETLPDDAVAQTGKPMLLLAKIPYVNGKGARKGTIRIERPRTDENTEQTNADPENAEKGVGVNEKREQTNANPVNAEQVVVVNRQRGDVVNGSKDAVAKLASDMVSIPGKNYAICKYEVTQALWEAVMGDNPSKFKGPNRPVEQVSLDDCRKFIGKLNAVHEVKESGFTYRLPTADEWEYACRAGATGDYCRLANGSEITQETLGVVAWFSVNSRNQTHPVGQLKANAFGLYDMHGNVMEWTSSTFDGGDHIESGGSWCHNAIRCKTTNRRRDYSGAHREMLGFRLAADRATNR